LGICCFFYQWPHAHFSSWPFPSLLSVVFTNCLCSFFFYRAASPATPPPFSLGRVPTFPLSGFLFFLTFFRAARKHDKIGVVIFLLPYSSTDTFRFPPLLVRKPRVCFLFFFCAGQFAVGQRSMLITWPFLSGCCPFFFINSFELYALPPSSFDEVQGVFYLQGAPVFFFMGVFVAAFPGFWKFAFGRFLCRSTSGVFSSFWISHPFFKIFYS